MFEPDGLRVQIRHSKPDQEGQGAQSAVPQCAKLLPVRAVQAWIAAAGIVDRRLFRGIDRHGRLGCNTGPPPMSKATPAL